MTPRRTRAPRPSCRSRLRARTRSAAPRSDPRAAPEAAPPLRPRWPFGLSSSSSQSSSSTSPLSDLSSSVRLPLSVVLVVEQVLGAPRHDAPGARPRSPPRHRRSRRRGSCPFWRSASAISAVERAGQNVDLVSRQLCAVGKLRLILREQPLEPEHQRVLAAATRSTDPRSPLSISASAASNARRQGGAGLQRFFVIRERLARPLLDASDCSREGTFAAFAATRVVFAISRLT